MFSPTTGRAVGERSDCPAVSGGLVFARFVSLAAPPHVGREQGSLVHSPKPPESGGGVGAPPRLGLIVIWL